MASLMARIKGVGQKTVAFDKKRRPIVPEGATSFFVLGRLNGKRAQIGDSHATVDAAVTALVNAEVMEKSGKLAADFEANATQPAEGTWSHLLSSYREELRREVKKGNTSPNTETTYNRMLDSFDAYVRDKGVTSLRDIDRRFTEGYKEYLMDRGARKGYVQHTKILHCIFQWGADQDQPLLTKVPITSETAAVSDRNPFLPEEIQRMEKVLVDEKSGVDDTFAFTLLRWTGLRLGDAADLRWKDVNGVITRTTQKSQTKNKKKVVIPVWPELRRALDAERVRQNNPAPDAHVLINNTTGKPFGNEQVLYHHIKELGKRAGVHAYPHRFRHSFVEFLYLRGVSIQGIEEMIGDDVKTIQKYYSKFSKARQEEDHRKFMGEPVAAAV